jgi:glycosyltransferase involved in cell wall biosynthesis
MDGDMVICGFELLDGKKSDSVKKKILVLVDWYEPGFKAGGPIQACKNVVNSLKKEYDFYILCSDRDLGDKIPYKNIETNLWLEIESSVHIWYASPDFMDKSRLLKLLNEVQPDFIYFNSMYSFKYTLFPLWVLLNNRFRGKIILAPRGMLHKGALKNKYIKKVVFLKLFLLIGWSRKIVFQATDEQERKDLQYFFSGKVNLIVVEDIPTVNEKLWREREKAKGELRLVFLSRIHPKKNLHYFLNLLRDINHEIEIKFDIYGFEDSPDYSEQCRKIASSLPSNIEVRFLGALPFTQVFETLNHYHVFVLSTMGENYGHAIFEALTTGLPVMISDQTPWKNLEQMKVGWDYPLQMKEKFIDAISLAAGWDQQQYNEWSAGAYSYAREYIHDLGALAKYKQLFSSPDKKRILLFTDWYEPGYKAGGPIQSCKNIVSILKGEYEFFIICSDRDLGDKKPYSNIPVNEWIKTSTTTNIWYASPNFITGKSLKNIFDIIRPDFVYFNSMYSPLYTLLPLWVLVRSKYSGKIILAPRGMLHKGALKRKYFKKYVFLRLFRLISWHRKVIFHATNKQEQRDILSFFSKSADITVLDNIPNTSFRQWLPKLKRPDELSCVFISRVHPKKNLYYFLKILSEIRNDVNLSFDIYGVEEDKNYAEDCKQLSSSLGKNIRVRFRGPIPYSQVFETMQAYHLFVLPTLGENYGHVIYEAMSAGDPVLISDQTPWGNLETEKAGWDIPLNEKDKFKEAIKKAVAWNQNEYNEWSQNAFELAKNSVDIPRLFERYKKLFG